MVNLSEKKLITYTSILTAILLNVFKLLSLRENAVLPHYWKFNAYEFTFQAVWNFLFCFVIGWTTVSLEKKKFNKIFYKSFYYFLFYLILFMFALSTGVIVQKKIFYDETPDKIFRALYFFRLFSSLIIEATAIRLFWLLQEKKLKDKENEQLKSVYLIAQLELLKQQLNPHFFFNTLSSLYTIIREDSKKAQQYILDLSKIFRYTLEQKDKSLVTVEEEISALNSYSQLLKMRFEENLKIIINVSEHCLKLKLPHMSLQPLLENAVKHNTASASMPLLVEIKCFNNCIEVSNNLQPIKSLEQSTGIGLSNLNERFKILTGKEISINKDDTKFTVTLPLL